MQPEGDESKLTSVAQRDDGGKCSGDDNGDVDVDVDGAANGSRDLKTSCSKIRLPSRGTRGEKEGRRGAKGGEDGPGSGNGGASSDWSGREEIASRLVIITPLTQLTSPPIALPIIFVIEPFGARDEIAFLRLSPWLLRSSECDPPAS